MANFKKNNKKSGWKTAGIIAAIIAVAALICGVFTVGYFNSRERNPDNLIKYDENYLVDQKTNYGLEVDVSEDGVIRLKGETSRNEELIVQTVTLPAGTYTISGIDKPNVDKVALKASWGNGSVAYAGLSNDTFVLDAETVVTVSITVQGAERDENVIGWGNNVIKPVIVEGDKPGDFWK